jgi:hypothetical protein
MRGWPACSSRRRTEGRGAGALAAPCLLLALLAAAPALAQPSVRAEADQRGWLDLSGYYPALRTRARADLPAVGAGTTIDFEERLGLDDALPLPAVVAGLRLGGGWWIEADYMKLRRSSTRRLDREIVWEGTTYPVNTVLDSRFDSDVVRASLGWSWIVRPEFELGAVLGLHATRFLLRLEGEGAVGRAAGSAVEVKEAWLPLPTVGLQGRVALGPRVDLGGRLDWLELSIDGHGGRLFNASLALHWRADRAYGAYFGWRLVDYAVTVDRSSWKGAFDYRFSGPQVGAVLRF